ncbi:MAG: hypothetical protein WDO68_02700 [Gammaproteobacteria bacterium]
MARRGGGKQNTEPHPLMAQVIPENKRLPRAELARIGNSYFTGLDTEGKQQGHSLLAGMSAA